MSNNQSKLAQEMEKNVSINITPNLWLEMCMSQSYNEKLVKCETCGSMVSMYSIRLKDDGTNDTCCPKCG
jgi:hypothetical protein